MYFFRQLLARACCVGLPCLPKRSGVRSLRRTRKHAAMQVAVLRSGCLNHTIFFDAHCNSFSSCCAERSERTRGPWRFLTYAENCKHNTSPLCAEHTEMGRSNVAVQTACVRWRALMYTQRSRCCPLGFSSLSRERWSTAIGMGSTWAGQCLTLHSCLWRVE